jgi:hypothetical protein
MGWPGVARGVVWASLATRSGRGGTTGRAAGWPAKGGLAGEPPAPAGAEGGCGSGGTGREETEGRGGPAVTLGERNSPMPAGKGWRGPERIEPGLGPDGRAATSG